MNIGGGEAADQLVRMMLSGSEVAVRLSGSAIKNMLALTMALAKNHKTISGKVNLVKMLKETRDVRRFSMSPEQYQQFRQRAGKQKILFSAIRDSDNKGKVVDVIMPVTEIDRANMIFERIRYTGQPEQARQDAPSKEQEARVGQEAPQREQQRPRQGETPVTPPVGKRQEVAPKKESRSGTDLPDTKGRLTSSSGRETAAGTMTSERPSVLERLKGYQAQLDTRQKSAPAKEKVRQKARPDRTKYQIACKLSADRIEIPVVHLARFNEGVNRSKPVKDPYGWGSSTIVNILKKREYLGHTINFKTRKHFKDKKSHYVSEDEWTIFENTHEAIIDQQTFDLVQKIRSNVRRYPNGWGEAAPLTGLLYCADCGGKMYVHRTNNGKRISQYTCSNYTKVPCGTLCPTQHRINESAVLTLVSDTLRAIAEYSRNDRTEFIHTVQETQVAQQSADISKKRRRLAAAQKRAGELEKLICKIYEDNALGKLPDARYKALDAQYAKEQDALEIEIAELEKAVTGYEQSQKSAEKFIALIDKYENFDTLTNTMLNEFVEKILVHERSRKGSQDTTQEIEIYFNFLGRYIPPSLQPVPLTPEEQEELQKKEERKDRLHQNYLKRKASGAQKRYEDKIKAKKKAEMDAKKALIRAEDMKKGVFSTIGQLPKEEPRKGSIAASAAV